MPTKDPAKKAAYWKKWYQKNTDRHKKHNAGLNKAARLLRKQWSDQKKAVPCRDCGIQYLPCVMQFDHVRGKKFKDVSVMVLQGYSMERLEEEAEKCEIVCANCHCLRTNSRKHSGVVAQSGER